MVFERGKRRIWSEGVEAMRNEWKGIKNRSCFSIRNVRRAKF